jgi:UDP-N-acetylglucosamine 2-epimerase (non-hydrolysing)
MSHPAMTEAMRRADLVLSDSGGMQEEAPTLGVPLLVLREKTERPEALATGSAVLVGTDVERIVATVTRLRRHRLELDAMSRPCLPFGDGRSAPRIAAHCLAFLEAESEELQSALA